MNEFLPVLVAVLVSTMILTLGMALRSERERRRLVVLDSPAGAVAVPSLRELELAKPWRERLFKPVLRRLYGAGRLLTPVRNIEQLQQDLILAGLFERLTVIDFLGLRIFAGVMVGLLVFLVMNLRGAFASALLFALAGFLVGLYLPNFWLRGRISRRQKGIARGLPDMLDRMSICVDAGLGFEAAIQKAALEGKDELALELRRVIGELRLGIPRGQALRHLVDRTGVAEVASFVAVLVQADQLGIAIRDVLHTQSAHMRMRRRQRAEEEAQKAPIKMLIPLVLFIFPALFAVILGPAIPRILAAF